MSEENDFQQRFIFTRKNIRGEFIRISKTLTDAIKNHQYSKHEKNLLAEMMCASGLLSSIIKFDGKLSVQLQSESILKLLLVQSDNKCNIRGLIQTSSKPKSADLLQIAAGGQILFSLKSEVMKEAYQSVVSLQSSSISENIEHYFQNSEQLATKLWLFSDGDVAAGLLMQQLPEMSDSEYWNHITILCSTLKQEEVLGLPFSTIMYRLFHQEQQEELEMFPERTVQFSCTCSRDRLATTLRVLDADEISDIIREQGKLYIICDFCNTKYGFTQSDIDKLSGDNNPEVLH